VFQFDKVLPDVGSVYPNSWVQYGNFTFGLATSGFKQIINGTEIRHIGANKIDRTFFDDLDSALPKRVIGAVDYLNKRIIWIYPGSGHNDASQNKALIYDITNDRWSEAEEETEWVFNYLSLGYTLDELDNVSSSLDALYASLDSRIWTGGDIALSAFDRSHKLGDFSGTPGTGYVSTPEVNINEQGMAFVSHVEPLVSGSPSSITTTAYCRDKLNDNQLSRGSSASNDEGLCHMRANGKYHRFELAIVGDFNHALGVNVKAKPSGMRGFTGSE
jgi:hypothetical protein